MGYIGEDIYILSLFVCFLFLFYTWEKKLRFALVDTFHNGLTD